MDYIGRLYENTTEISNEKVNIPQYRRIKEKEGQKKRGGRGENETKAADKEESKKPTKLKTY